MLGKTVTDKFVHQFWLKEYTFFFYTLVLLEFSVFLWSSTLASPQEDSISFPTNAPVVKVQSTPFPSTKPTLFKPVSKKPASSHRPSKSLKPTTVRPVLYISPISTSVPTGSLNAVSSNKKPTFPTTHIPTVSTSTRPFPHSKLPTRLPSRLSTHLPSSSSLSITSNNPSKQPTLSPLGNNDASKTKVPVYRPTYTPNQYSQLGSNPTPTPRPSFGGPYIVSPIHPESIHNLSPTYSPSGPSRSPSAYPTNPTFPPTALPSNPSVHPTEEPTYAPTNEPVHLQTGHLFK